MAFYFGSYGETEAAMLILTRRVGETLVIGDDVTVTVLGVKGNQVRLGVKPDAAHVGGLNIFGKSFGNHAQDIVLKLNY